MTVWWSELEVLVFVRPLVLQRRVSRPLVSPSCSLLVLTPSLLRY